MWNRARVGRGGVGTVADVARAGGPVEMTETHLRLRSPGGQNSLVASVALEVWTSLSQSSTDCGLNGVFREEYFMGSSVCALQSANGIVYFTVPHFTLLYSHFTLLYSHFTLLC